MTSPRAWPPYLRPPWLAAYAAGLGAWLGLYALGGWTLVAVTAGAGSYGIARVLWWLHTASEREAAETLRHWRGGEP